MKKHERSESKVRGESLEEIREHTRVVTIGKAMRMYRCRLPREPETFSIVTPTSLAHQHRKREIKIKTIEAERKKKKINKRPALKVVIHVRKPKERKKKNQAYEAHKVEVEHKKTFDSSENKAPSQPPFLPNNDK